MMVAQAGTECKEYWDYRAGGLWLNGEMIPRLYPILDAGFLPARGPARAERLRLLTAELLEAGVTLLQYRNKGGDEAEILADGRVLRAAAPPGSCVLILNDYPELAGRSGFDGAHVGQEDVTPADARELVGVEGIVGVSTHNPEQLAAAEVSSADYVATGPVFATSSKLNPDPVVGLEGVRLARRLTKKPLVAIGGITLENCVSVIEAGADSVAVISSLFADASGRPPGKIARDFLAKLL
jgi:thiamine-phosphate pyrophosphorylase